MKSRYLSLLLSVSAMAAAIGCGQENTGAPDAAGNLPSRPKGSRLVLAAEPSGAKGVLEIRDSAKDGDDVVLLGRVGGSNAPFVKGRTAFTIVDASLKPCNEHDNDACSTPWDYCSVDSKELAHATVMIRFVDDKGIELQKDAQAYFGVKPSKTVVIRGRAQRDQKGSLVVLAREMFIRP